MVPIRSVRNIASQEPIRSRFTGEGAHAPRFEELEEATVLLQSAFPMGDLVVQLLPVLISEA